MGRVTYTEPKVGSSKTAASVNSMTTAMAGESARIDESNHKVEAYDFTTFVPDAFTQVYQRDPPGAGLFYRQLTNLSAPPTTAGDWNFTGGNEPLISFRFNPTLIFEDSDAMRVRFYCEVSTDGDHLGGLIGPSTAEVRIKLRDGNGNFQDISGTRRWVGYTNDKASGQRGSGCLATSCVIRAPLDGGLSAIFPVFTFPAPYVIGTVVQPKVEFHNMWFDAVKFSAVKTSNIEMTLVP